jgi:hypothetical protein
MPRATVKQTRDMYKKISRALDRLGDDLNKAHRMGIIVYPADKYQEEGPCDSLWELVRRFDRTTQAALADAFRRETMGQR